MKHKVIFSAALLVFSALFATHSFAHCDTLDGPVVIAARQALDAPRMVVGKTTH